jgi:hypothetical protein
MAHITDKLQTKKKSKKNKKKSPAPTRSVRVTPNCTPLLLGTQGRPNSREDPLRACGPRPHRSWRSSSAPAPAVPSGQGPSAPSGTGRVVGGRRGRSPARGKTFARRSSSVVLAAAAQSTSVCCWGRQMDGLLSGRTCIAEKRGT